MPGTISNTNNDPNVATSLAQVESGTIFPRPAGAIKDKYDDDDPLVRHTDVVAHVTNGRIPTYEIPGLGDALKNLESKRKSDYEDWLTELGLDAVVWPCNGEVGKADADVNEKSAAEAWRNGVLYSNGNCAIRQLGIPTVSVPMGVMADIGMPVNLTFASKAYDDNNLFRYTYAFEKASKLRQAPKRTPALASDTFEVAAEAKKIGSVVPELTAAASVVEDKEGKRINVSGKCGKDLASLDVYIDGEAVENVKLEGGQWSASAVTKSLWNGREEEKAVPDPHKAMVIILAKGTNGRSAGKMIFV